MPVSLTNIRDLLLPALLMSPEERGNAKEEHLRVMAIKAAEEPARYNALSEREKAEYDLLTAGMMPRMAGANELRGDARRRLRDMGEP